MTKAELENKLRNTYMDMIRTMVTEQVETDALTVGANEIAVPCLDADGNEKFVIIKVSIPRGTRNGDGGYDPYDGYAAAEDYAAECEEKAQKKAKAEEKKQAKIARDQQKRAEKAALAEANKGLKELRKVKLTEKKEEGDNYANEYAPHELTDMLN